MKEGVPITEKKKKEKKKKSSQSNAFKNVIAGDMLSSFKLEKHIFYILFIILLLIIYIGNGYQNHALVKQNENLDKEIRELRAEFVSSQARLINRMKFLNIQDEVEKKGLELKELKKPPYTISAHGH